MKKKLAPREEDMAFRDAEILCEQINLLESEVQTMFKELKEDMTKVGKLQCKAVARVRKKLLYTKKRIDNAYKSLGKFKDRLTGDGGYEKLFIEL